MKVAGAYTLPTDVILGHTPGTSQRGPVTVHSLAKPHIVGTGSMVLASAAISLADGLPEKKYKQLPCKHVQMGK